MLVHILHVFIPLSPCKGDAGGWTRCLELNSMIFKGPFQPNSFYDCLLLMLSFACSVQVSLVYHKHPRDFWIRYLADFTSSSDNGKKAIFGGVGQS